MGVSETHLLKREPTSPAGDSVKESSKHHQHLSVPISAFPSTSSRSTHNSANWDTQAATNMALASMSHPGPQQAAAQAHSQVQRQHLTGHNATVHPASTEAPTNLTYHKSDKHVSPRLTADSLPDTAGLAAEVEVTASLVKPQSPWRQASSSTRSSHQGDQSLCSRDQVWFPHGAGFKKENQEIVCLPDPLPISNYPQKILGARAEGPCMRHRSEIIRETARFSLGHKYWWSSPDYTKTSELVIQQFPDLKDDASPDGMTSYVWFPHGDGFKKENQEIVCLPDPLPIPNYPQKILGARAEGPCMRHRSEIIRETARFSLGHKYWWSSPDYTKTSELVIQQFPDLKDDASPDGMTSYVWFPHGAGFKKENQEIVCLPDPLPIPNYPQKILGARAEGPCMRHRSEIIRETARFSLGHKYWWSSPDYTKTSELVIQQFPDLKDDASPDGMTSYKRLKRSLGISSKIKQIKQESAAAAAVSEPSTSAGVSEDMTAAAALLQQQFMQSSSASSYHPSAHLLPSFYLLPSLHTHTSLHEQQMQLQEGHISPQSQPTEEAYSAKRLVKEHSYTRAEAGKIILDHFIQQEAAMSGGDETVEDVLGLDEDITEASTAKHSGSIYVDQVILSFLDGYEGNFNSNACKPVDKDEQASDQPPVPVQPPLKPPEQQGGFLGSLLSDSWLKITLAINFVFNMNLKCYHFLLFLFFIGLTLTAPSAPSATPAFDSQTCTWVCGLILFLYNIYGVVKSRFNW